MTQDQNPLPPQQGPQPTPQAPLPWQQRAALSAQQAGMPQQGQVPTPQQVGVPTPQQVGVPTQSYRTPYQQASYGQQPNTVPPQHARVTPASYHPYSYQQQQTPRAAYGPQMAMPAEPSASPAVQGVQTAKKRPGLISLVMGLVGVLIGALLTGGILFIVTDGFAPVTQEVSTQAGNVVSPANITVNPPAEDATLAEAVAAKTLPSVVNIDVFTSSSGGLFGDSATDGGADSLEQYGLGSGVVISEDGYILTNYHVVEGGTEYLVRFDQQTQFKASVVGEDPTSDLAVLKVDAKGLVPIDIGDSSQVRVGQWVMALGSPFGLEKSVSTGIVSALFRSTAMESTTGVNFYANMIQTDAAINPGNSGGALVNAKGELIGINTLISSSSGASAGVGFAIPSNYAMNIAQQIMDGKVVEHAFLGVQLRSVDAGNASSLNSSVDAGAYIGLVVEGSPAEVAGLQVGDVITKLDDTPIASAAELVINIRGHLVGDTVTLEFLRDGKSKTIKVTLGSDSA